MNHEGQRVVTGRNGLGRNRLIRQKLAVVSGHSERLAASSHMSEAYKAEDCPLLGRSYVHLGGVSNTQRSDAMHAYVSVTNRCT